MKTLLKRSPFVVAALLIVTPNDLLAEESASMQQRWQPSQAEEPIRHSSERFNDMLDEQPTASGPRQDEAPFQAPAPRRYEPPRQPHLQDRGQQH